MSDMPDIKSLIYQTIHRNKLSINEIAEIMGVSSQSLYRYGLDGDSGSDMPLFRLIPLMRATNNYSILHRIANLCGFIMIKVPKFRNRRMDDIDLIDGFQGVSLRAISAMKKFIETPVLANYEEVEKILAEHMQRSAEAQKYCHKKLVGQFNFLDENNL